MSPTERKDPPGTPEEDLKAKRFAQVAHACDTTIKAALGVLFEQFPEDEDAVLSGAMTALVRFGVERQQAAKGPAFLGVRDVFGYFARYVQRAAEILLDKPGRSRT